MQLRLCVLFALLIHAHLLRAQCYPDTQDSHQWDTRDNEDIQLSLRYPVFRETCPHSETLNQWVQTQVSSMRQFSQIKKGSGQTSPPKERNYFLPDEDYGLDVFSYWINESLCSFEAFHHLRYYGSKHGGRHRVETTLFDLHEGRWLQCKSLLEPSLMDSLGSLLLERVDESSRPFLSSLEPADAEYWQYGFEMNALVAYLPGYHCMDEAIYVEVQLPLKEAKPFLNAQGRKLLGL